MNTKILLYYKYVEITNPEELKKQQVLLCNKLDLRGRIIIAKEGINGTVEGPKDACDEYRRVMSKYPEFGNIHWKISDGNGNAFPKLSIKVRTEIVSLHLDNDDIDPNQITGKYLNPEELHNWFESKKEFYIVDMRNDYEHKVGIFEGSILPKLTNFRDLPSLLPELAHLKNKTILTVCTGGVRCEKASGYLVKSGFEDVYQLAGGIVSYMELYPNQNFLGKLYVFDGRVTMGFNTDSNEHQIISDCEICEKKSDFYADCAYKHCKGKRHFIACEDCRDENGLVYCSETCEEQAQNLQAFFYRENIIFNK